MSHGVIHVHQSELMRQQCPCKASSIKSVSTTTLVPRLKSPGTTTEAGRWRIINLTSVREQPLRIGVPMPTAGLIITTGRLILAHWVIPPLAPVIQAQVPKCGMTGQQVSGEQVLVLMGRMIMWIVVT